MSVSLCYTVPHYADITIITITGIAATVFYLTEVILNIFIEQY